MRFAPERRPQLQVLALEALLALQRGDERLGEDVGAVERGGEGRRRPEHVWAQHGRRTRRARVLRLQKESESPLEVRRQVLAL